MRTQPQKNITEIKRFLEAFDKGKYKFYITEESQRYFWIRQTTWNLKYKFLKKKEKSIVKKYLIALLQ